MAAPKGNDYAVGNKGGRPTDYKPEYCDKIVKFFDVEPYTREIIATSKGYGAKGNKTFEKNEWGNIPSRLPTLYRFCKTIDVKSVQTLYNWAAQHKEFLEAMQTAAIIYKEFLIENGLIKTYSSTFAKFVGVNTTDMKDLKEIAHTPLGPPKDNEVLDNDAAKLKKIGDKYNAELRKQLMGPPIEAEAKVIKTKTVKPKQKPKTNK